MTDTNNNVLEIRLAGSDREPFRISLALLTDKDLDLNSYLRPRLIRRFADEIAATIPDRVKEYEQAITAAEPPPGMKRPDIRFEAVYVRSRVLSFEAELWSSLARYLTP